MAKRSVLSLLLLSAIVSTLYFSWHWYTTGRFVEKTDNAYVEAKIAALSAHVPGYITQVLVKENQPVKTGDLLFVINPVDYIAKVNNATAQLEASQARAITLNEQLNLQESLILQAQADANSASAELNRVRKDLQRYQQLESVSASSQQQLEAVQAEEQKALAATQSANARVNAQKNQLLVLTAQTNEVAAAIAQAQSLLDLAKINLADTEVKAPIDGIVGNKHIELGRYLQAGTPAVNVVSVNDVYVTANFKETQIENMRVGQKVKVTLDAYPHQPLAATLASISPASGSRFSLLPPENATGNFSKIVQRIPVRIEFNDKNALQGLLRPGLSAVVEVDTHSPVNTALPQK